MDITIKFFEFIAGLFILYNEFKTEFFGIAGYADASSVRTAPCNAAEAFERQYLLNQGRLPVTQPFQVEPALHDQVGVYPLDMAG